MNLTSDFIRQQIADSDIIFRRGQHIYRHGAMVLRDIDLGTKQFVYAMDLSLIHISEPTRPTT